MIHNKVVSTKQSHSVLWKLHLIIFYHHFTQTISITMKMFFGNYWKFDSHQIRELNSCFLTWSSYSYVVFNSIDNGRVQLNVSETICRILVKNAKLKDEGRWDFAVSTTNNFWNRDHIIYKVLVNGKNNYLIIIIKNEH